MKTSDYPVDESTPFRPTKIFHIRQEHILAPSFHITDVTAAAAGTVDIYQKPDVAAQVDAAAKANPVFLDVIRRSWTERTLEAVEPGSSKEAVATLSGPLAALGRWTLTFADATHAAHAVEMRPTGMGHKADVFVLDSVPFFWDPCDGGRVLWELFKVVGGKRVLVGAYSVAHHWNKNGVLGVDTDQVDEVVAIMTCVAAIGRSDSFRK
ncbi:hypothetical protein QBC47DRAFT_393978 [Echria macrotheca]|uniref:Uncharacterized protein n=1 Tax=Echria macrotheca TaxID=438768 RepID=A0AAJ0F1V2_9PEZI|nr:hypothetical protein QBC47DRAFT_393978 [Echria macrotheca]